jgi:hypothetical protein
LHDIPVPFLAGRWAGARSLTARSISTGCGVQARAAADAARARGAQIPRVASRERTSCSRGRRSRPSPRRRHPEDGATSLRLDPHL